jgi:chromosome partitioning protein
MVDGDRQGSAQMCVAVRAELGRMPGFTCVQYHDGAVLRARAQRQASKYDDVVIDAGGRDSALSPSDLLIVPFLPGRLMPGHSLISPAWLMRPMGSATICELMLCSTLPIRASSDNTGAVAALTDFPQLKLRCPDPPAQGVCKCHGPMVFSDAFNIKIAEGTMK